MVNSKKINYYTNSELNSENVGKINWICYYYFGDVK